MDESDLKDWTRAFDELMAFYESPQINHNIWWRALGKYSLEQVIAGFEAHITDPQEGKYPPKPAHIIGQIERLYPNRTAAYKLYEPLDPKPTSPGLKNLRGGDPTSAWLEAHAADPIVKRAHLLARGKGSREDKRDHLADLMKLANRIATPLPYDPRAKVDRFNAGPESSGPGALGRRELSTEGVASFEEACYEP
jgi:hypothetical protein